MDVRRDEQSPHRREPYAGEAGLAGVLMAVGVLVVEHLADDVGAVGDGIRDDAHGGVGDVGHDGVGQRVEGERLVGLRPVRRPRTDHQQHRQGALLVRQKVDVGPDEIAAAHLRRGGDSVEAPAARAETKPGRQPVDDVEVDQRAG